MDGQDSAPQTNGARPMPPAISLKTVTNNVGWGVLSKTITFGLKFVTVPIHFALDPLRFLFPSKRGNRRAAAARLGQRITHHTENITSLGKTT